MSIYNIRLQFTDYDVNVETSFGVFDGTDSPYGGIFSPFPPNTSVIPPIYESNSDFIGINFSVGEGTAGGWRLTYQIEEFKPQPLLTIDSATTTLLMAVLVVLGFFFAGIVPP